MNATNWRRAAVASAAAWLPWVLVVMAAAAALFGAWWIWGTQAAVGFLAAWWSRLLIGAAAAVILSVFVWWLWWRLPKQQVDRLRHAIRDPKARTDVEDNFRKTAGQLLGGAAVLIGAGIAYVQFTQQQQNSQRQFEQQQQAAHDLLISNQVAKGFELLGNGNIEQRVGGIYALEGVMNGSEQYHRSVLEALCAFVRNETRTTSGDAPPAADIQAALAVIGRRKQAIWWVDLAGARIPKAELPEFDLSEADLSGADLSKANFVEAIVAHSYLNGANLTGTDLRDAYLELTNLTRADLTGADLSGADLPGADLRGAIGLTQGQLDGACGDDKTKLDPPLTIKPCMPDQPAAGGTK